MCLGMCGEMPSQRDSDLVDVRDGTEERKYVNAGIVLYK